MSSNDASIEKRIVNQLNFGQKTARRVTWERWSFSIAGPQQIEVTNESYGVEKDDHRYVVTVKEVDDGVFVPAECECPADKWNDYSCKHRVACATVGGPVLLGAAMAYTSDTDRDGDSDRSDPTTVADKIRTDGGATVRPDTDERPDDCDCAPFMGGLPCWPCYREGFEEPNPDVEEADE